jgi:hypothetical protein
LQVEVATSVAAGCCPDPLPSTLHLTGNLGLGTIPLVYDGSRYWASSSSAVSCGAAVQFRLECTGTTASDFALDVSCDGTFWVPMGLNLLSASCSPLNLDYSKLISPNEHCAPCSNLLQVTVTT